MPLPIAMGNRGIRILPFSLILRCTDYADNVESKPPLPSFPSPIPILAPAKPALDNRLVLHLLCPQLPALSHSTSDHSPLVSLPSPSLKSAVGATLGHHSNKDSPYC